MNANARPSLPAEYEEVPTHDADGQVTALGYRRVPVLSPAQIAQLPARRVVIIRRGMPPAVGRVQMAWRRRDVRRVRRQERRAGQAERLHDLAARLRAHLTPDTGQPPRPIAEPVPVPELAGDGDPGGGDLA